VREETRHGDERDPHHDGRMRIEEGGCFDAGTANATTAGAGLDRWTITGWASSRAGRNFIFLSCGVRRARETERRGGGCRDSKPQSRSGPSMRYRRFAKTNNETSVFAYIVSQDCVRRSSNMPGASNHAELEELRGEF